MATDTLTKPTTTSPDSVNPLETKVVGTLKGLGVRENTSKIAKEILDKLPLDTKITPEAARLVVNQVLGKDSGLTPSETGQFTAGIVEDHTRERVRREAAENRAADAAFSNIAYEAPTQVVPNTTFVTQPTSTSTSFSAPTSTPEVIYERPSDTESVEYSPSTTSSTYIDPFTQPTQASQFSQIPSRTTDPPAPHESVFISGVEPPPHQPSDIGPNLTRLDSAARFFENPLAPRGESLAQSWLKPKIGNVLTSYSRPGSALYKVGNFLAGGAPASSAVAAGGAATGGAAVAAGGAGGAAVAGGVVGGGATVSTAPVWGTVLGVIVLTLIVWTSITGAELQPTGGGVGGPGGGGGETCTPGEPDCAVAYCDPSLSDCSWPVSSGCVTVGPSNGDPGSTHRTMNAIDIAPSSHHMDVTATHDGEVVGVVSSFGDNDFAEGSYGNYIKLKGVDTNGTTFYTLYSHLWIIAEFQTSGRILQVGDVIKKGDPLGKTDNNGTSYGEHLHYEYIGGGDISLILPVPVPHCTYGKCPSICW